jgi:hypothetical protein
VGGLGLYMSTYDSAASPLTRMDSRRIGPRNSARICFAPTMGPLDGGEQDRPGRRHEYGRPEFPKHSLWTLLGHGAAGGWRNASLHDRQQRMDLNKDGVIDQKDVNLMKARLNTQAKPNDPMDLNQDGKITRADVQLLMTQCTYPTAQCRRSGRRPARWACRWCTPRRARWAVPYRCIGRRHRRRGLPGLPHQHVAKRHYAASGLWPNRGRMQQHPAVAALLPVTPRGRSGHTLWLPGRRHVRDPRYDSCVFRDSPFDESAIAVFRAVGGFQR